MEPGFLKPGNAYFEVCAGRFLWHFNGARLPEARKRSILSAAACYHRVLQWSQAS